MGVGLGGFGLELLLLQALQNGFDEIWIGQIG
jgi:hypothetical protein